MTTTPAAKLIGIAFLTALTACGGSNSTGSNPITGGPLVDETVDPADPNTSNAQRFAFDLDAFLVANSVGFDDNGTPADPTDDVVNINNIPFDTTTGNYNYAYTLPQGFAVYENDERGNPGILEYTAVFRQSDSGLVEGGVAASPRWTGSRGNAGAVVRRLNSTVTLPVDGIINYSGTYGGVRELENDGFPVGDARNSLPGIQVVDGTASITIDFNDFDVVGDVIGFIRDRVVYDADTGAAVGTLADVGLAESRFDRATGTIDESDAVSIDGLVSGTWTGVFGGAAGEEVAAYVILEGVTPEFVAPTLADPVGVPGVNVRELGVLLVAQ